MECSTSSSSGITCPITGFQFFLNKKFLVGSIISIIWFNLFSCFWHGSVLMGAYEASASLWRGPQEMNPMLLNGGISIMAIFATYIFMKGYSGTGMREGLRFGIIMTLLFAGLGMVTFATQPIPRDIIQMWVLGDLIQYSVGGMILAMYFGKKTGCCQG